MFITYITKYTDYISIMPKNVLATQRYEKPLALYARMILAIKMMLSLTDLLAWHDT